MWNVVDTHTDALLRLSDDAPRLLNDRHINEAGLRSGGAALIAFAAFTDAAAQGTPSLPLGLKLVDRYWRMTEAYADWMAPVASMAQYEQARAAGKVGALLTIEGGGILQGDLAVLRLLHRLGARMFSLTWSNTTELGCGCASPEDTGLTPLGFSAVEECNRLGIILDVSHLSDKGFWQLLEHSRQPVAASHSDARALCPDQKRDLTDEMLKALGAAGGYVGVNYCHPFLTNSGDVPAALEDVVRHIEHMAEYAGVAHVGIGTDYDGIPAAPKGLEDCSTYPRVAEALLKRGWAEEDVKGIMGENFLRLFAEVCG
ncbi:MAG: dipeptidase [Eubacteriales bacterium]|nr:dipeptidase [Eubacteriales bacterium]